MAVPANAQPVILPDSASPTPQILVAEAPAPSQKPAGTDDSVHDAVMMSGRRVMTAERLHESEEIALDWALDESAWRRAQPATDFVQQDPILGGTPTEPTEVRIIFNRTTLYMGVVCFDSEPDKLLGNTMKRDEFLGADDRFMWTLDTFLDQQTGYFFEMNPSGLMADSVMGASGDNRNWDGLWNARVRRSDIGWTIEIEIPFSTMNFDRDAPAWGINFQRTIRRKNEENLWTGHERNQGLRRMSNAGLLVGIRDVSQGRGLELRPYAAANLAAAPGREVPEPLDGDGDVGLDLFYSVTPSLRGTVTINTDFAETEVDQRRVNLTRFPLFFPEKRAFFLDGATFFDFYRGTGGPGGFGGGGGGGGVAPAALAWVVEVEVVGGPAAGAVADSVRHPCDSSSAGRSALTKRGSRRQSTWAPSSPARSDNRMSGCSSSAPGKRSRRLAKTSPCCG